MAKPESPIPGQVRYPERTVPTCSKDATKVSASTDLPNHRTHIFAGHRVLWTEWPQSGCRSLNCPGVRARSVSKNT
jgi:hypothetical protein